MSAISQISSKYYHSLNEINQAVLQKANQHLLDKKVHKTIAEPFFSDSLEDQKLLKELNKKVLQQISSLPSDHPLADTDLLLFPDNYTGILPLNGIQNNELNAAVSLYDEIVNEASHILISGDKGFCEKIHYDIRLLLSRKIGRDLLDEIAYGNRPVLIEKQGEMQNTSTQESQENEDWGAIVGLIKISENAIKSYVTTISHRSKKRLLIPAPRFLVLAHELIHEYHQQQDMTNSLINQYQDTPDEYDNNEEKITIRGYLFQEPLWKNKITKTDDWSEAELLEEIEPFSEWAFFSAFGLLVRDDHRGGGIFPPQANPKERDSFLNTPLHVAIDYDATIDMHDLIQRGADPNAQNQGLDTPLHQAVRKKNVSFVRLLLKSGGNPNLKNLKGRTPLHESVRTPHLEIMKMLLEKNADSSLKDASNNSPMDILKNMRNQMKIGSKKKRKLLDMQNILQSYLDVQKKEKQKEYNHFIKKRRFENFSSSLSIKK